MSNSVSIHRLVETNRFEGFVEGSYAYDDGRTSIDWVFNFTPNKSDGSLHTDLSFQGITLTPEIELAIVDYINANEACYSHISNVASQAEQVYTQAQNLRNEQFDQFHGKAIQDNPSASFMEIYRQFEKEHPQKSLSFNS